jgi:hypothetical protein
MANDKTLGEVLREQGISRRGFLKFCAATASLMALPPTMVPVIAAALEKARRPSVIWLSFQECTGCTESLTRSHAPTLEGLIFDSISLDYHHTLQAASGDHAEQARMTAMEENYGKYIMVVDGSIPMGNPGYSTIAGISNVDMRCHCGGQLCILWRYPGRQSQPDRCGVGSRSDHGQTDYQCTRLSPHPGGHYRRADTLPDLWHDSGSRSSRSPHGLLWQEYP